MRPIVFPAVCLLLGASCAHSQQREPNQPQTTQAQNSNASDPGSMQMVPVAERDDDRAAEEMRSTAALPPQPIQSNEQPLHNGQPLSTGQQPLVTPSDARNQSTAATQPLGAPPEGSARNQGTASTQSVTEPQGSALQRPEHQHPDNAPTAANDARKLNPKEIQLRERIQSTLATTNGLSYSARHVSIGVEKQDVTLTGDVRNEREKNDVQSLVQQIQGVRRVKNRLAVVNQTIVRPTQGSTESGARTEGTRTP